MDNLKLAHFKLFGSTEKLYQNTRKYRTVFDEREACRIYAELAFYNKRFDEDDWTADIRLVCTNTATNEEICAIHKQYPVAKTENVYSLREGWGTEEPGWWKSGKYRWDAYLGSERIASAHFYITNVGLVGADGKNPFFAIKAVRLFESGSAGLEVGKRRYLKTFHSATARCINIELGLENLADIKPFPLELQFNYYNDAGQLKGRVEFFAEITDGRKALTLDTGYGPNNAGFWFEDNYTLEIVFMDNRIGIVPFKVAHQEEEHSGSLPFSPLAPPPAQGGISPTPTTNPTNETAPTKPEKRSFAEASAQLKSLIGLESVKEQLEEFSAYLQFLQIRKKKGFQESGQFNMHTVFTGNPGTGKTTVAKMLGEIYYSLDLLSKGHVHEVGRGELVGEYIGQTAPKVQKAIEKARGGILFIDEAYALTNRGNDGKDFGQEVIEILLKEMSDGTGDLAIVFAGYPEEMNQFVNSNPGLSSRLSNIIHFPDYVPDELMQIADYHAQKKDVIFTPEARTFLHRQIVTEYRDRDRHFGNARYVNGIVEECKQNMAIRLMRSGHDLEAAEKTMLATIVLEDVEKAFGLTPRKEAQIPVDEPMFQEALAELHALVGMDDVKREVDELAKLVRYYTEIGRNVRQAFSLHTVFTGNPGTGKTTVARIVTKIYRSLGILERGHLVETDRQGLVAGYIGQTAIRTDEMIQAAMGGCLFIDEAYALNKPGGAYEDFGKEAVDTLLKRMEDYRGQFMVIVAGYTDEMKRFLEMNPGLLSRFDRTLHFPDYSETELMEIAFDMLEADNLRLSESARTALLAHVQDLLTNKHRYFGNGRTIRKIVKEIVRRQNLRLAAAPSEARVGDAICTVEPEDIIGIKLIDQQNDDQRRRPIGF